MAKKASELQSVKGMNDLEGDVFYDKQGFFEKAQEVAVYYGFKPIETPILEQQDLFIRSIKEGTDIIDKEMYALKTKGGDKLVMRPEGTAPVMRAYIEHGMRARPQPVMFYYSGPFFRHDKPQKGRYRQFNQFGLEILGTDKPVADALVIQTTLTILREAGASDLHVNINSIGDTESRKSYERELKAYYRKHVNKLGTTDRERLKTNVLRILDSKDPKTIAINAEAPQSVSHLSATSKKHFKAVLEYLEELGIAYTIDKNLVRGLDYYSDTVFEITEPVVGNDGYERHIAICGGGRYNYLAKSIGHRKEVPGVGVGIGIERVIESNWWKHLHPRIIKKPKAFFIQLGFDARLKSITLLECLRKGKIPVYQSISKDSLSSQLGLAEKMEIPFAIIYGQKEAMDGTAIVRDMRKRSQKTVKIEKLCEYLRKIK